MTARERVELVETLVAHEVRPEASVSGPEGVIDEYGHLASLGVEPRRPVDFATGFGIR
jgi:hypothetical protein